MIGFELEACSSEGFYYKKGGWTEGDLWLAKAALKASKNKVASVGANEALIDAIEDQFTHIKELYIDEAVSDTPKFELNVYEDFSFSYTFDPKKSADKMRLELAEKIAQCGNDMGDQVAIALFECISKYKVHYLTKKLYSKFNYNFLNVWIYL